MTDKKNISSLLMNRLTSLGRFVPASKRLASLLLLFVLFVLWLGIGVGSTLYEFRDDATGRAAALIESDPFDDDFASIAYLDQGWSEADSLWFYNISQGSNLMPYDFFLHLEQADNSELFRSDANINAYRYLPQNASALNPDGLPVGMTLDTYQGKRYMGFTCAACHTSQLNFEGTGIRIDGGPALADMESFMEDLAAAMQATLQDETKLARFVTSVLAESNYRNEDAVLADLEQYALRLQTYVIVNSPRDTGRPLTTYGYARLDAFGRIFNRVLEHIISAEQLEVLLSDIVSPDELQSIMEEVSPVLTADEKDHLIARTQNSLSARQLLTLRNELFNPADAPVSYPFLWDTPQHDYVQWNGMVANAELGPMGRNAGQVIGVFGTLDWQERRGISLSSLLGGQGLHDTHIDFQSSVDIRNLRRVENHLRRLESPAWPENILPDIDQELAAQGRLIYAEYCESCHELIDPTDPDRRVIASLSRLESVGTDSKMANNSVNFNGYSGILYNNYVEVSTGDVLLQKQAAIAALLKLATANVVATPDPDKWLVQRWAERAFDFAATIFDNSVQPSIKVGDYRADTTAEPFASLLSYKARPLNGIWATAPYLHNGSVPTLYHLLLPKKNETDPEDGEYRPDEFRVGSREFDAENVGLRWDGYEGFEFRTDIHGNSNAGHEYAAGRSPQLSGEVLPALDGDERLALLEYLKTL